MATLFVVINSWLTTETEPFIHQSLKHLWTSNKPQKQAIVKSSLGNLQHQWMKITVGHSAAIGHFSTMWPPISFFCLTHFRSNEAHANYYHMELSCVHVHHI